MPRVRHNSRLVRIPLPAWAVFELAFYYPPENDGQLFEKRIPEWLQSNSDVLRGIAQRMVAGPMTMTPRQRLVLLGETYPGDSRLIGLRAKLAKEKNKFAAEVRENPSAAYAAERQAEEFALRRRREVASGVGKTRIGEDPY